MTRRVSLHYWEGPLALIRTLGPQKLQTHGNRRNDVCIKAGSHVTRNNPQFYFEIRFPNPPLIWFHSEKTVETVLQLAMRLCDHVKALPDSPFSRVSYSRRPSVSRHWHTLESNANCLTMGRLHKHLWLFSLLHCREFIVRWKWRVKIKPWLHNIVFQSVLSCFGLSVRHMFRRFPISHRLWITDRKQSTKKATSNVIEV